MCIFDVLRPDEAMQGLSREVFAILAALRAGDPRGAAFRTFRLRCLARRLGLSDTHKSAHALEVALSRGEAPDAPFIVFATSRLVRAMVRNGAVHCVAVDESVLN